MLANYLRTAVRSARRRESYTLINVAGLTISLAAALLIFRYVAHETSYDTFHEDADRLYRVAQMHERGGQVASRTATVYAGVGPALEASIPEVEESARLTRRYGGGVIRHGDRFFREEAIFHADQSILTMLSYPLVEGHVEAALTDPNTTVLSEKAARKYFGSEPAVGQTITFGADENYRVTAVVEVPSNSHIQFDFLFSYQTLERLWDFQVDTDWSSLDFLTYIRLSDADRADVVENRLAGFTGEHRPIAEGERMTLFLQPIRSIHLHSDLLFEPSKNGDAGVVRLLGVIAILILVIAWFNYVNLSTARSVERARETGVRKSLGAFRSQLVSQFLVESLVVNVLAVGLAILLAASLAPYLSRLAGLDVTSGLGGNLGFWILVVSVIAAGTLTSGFYPAVVLSSYEPIQVLKGAFTRAPRGRRLTTLLVTTQFAATIALFAGTIIVYQQLRYMENQPLGIDIDRTLVVGAPGVVMDNAVYTRQFESFKTGLRELQFVRDVATSSEVPGSSDVWLNTVARVGADRDVRASLYVVSVDYDYLPVYGHSLIAGRFFRPGNAADSSSVVLNEQAIELLQLSGPEAALGSRIAFRDDTLEVVGVIANHHQQGLHTAKYQMAFRIVPEEFRHFSVKLGAYASDSELAQIERVFNEFFPGAPYIGQRLEDRFAAQYDAPERFGTVVNMFALVSILVACLGLFGLASFAAQQRSKDVAVRRVFGATISQVVVLLNRDFVLLVTIAALAAGPAAYFVGQRWLEGFAYRVDPGLVPFVAAAVFAAGLALATVSFHSVRAALANPVESLRYE